jgi:glyoxylase-like metal-dependent hydrolase (beta-lactamase superfamily II)
VTALYTPCHTQDSICWLMEDSTGKVIFTGDTLFHGGMLPYRNVWRTCENELADIKL